MATLKRKADATSAIDPKKPKKDASLTSFFGAPKVISTPTPEVNTKFDKDKWVESLNEEQRKLLKLEIDTLDPSWLAHLKEDITTNSFLDLKRFIQREIDSGKKIFPPLEEVYSWSRHTPLTNVKAVILGQDPYHNVNQAHGLCFSVRPPTPAPPSLKNMFIALKKDYPSFTPPPKNGGLLTPWANQGVLLINTCLTVRAHEANSHSKKGWEQFTQKVIDTVAKVRTRGVVFLAWGTPAQSRCTKITSKHLVLKSVHPSPLSASRGFFDCGHFKKTNEWLEQRYGKDGIIDWNLNVSAPIIEPAKTPIKATNNPATTTINATDNPATTTINATDKSATTDVSTSVGNKSATKDEFEDDEDAIEALEELAEETKN